MAPMRSTAVVLAAAMALAGCAQGLQPGDTSTGSILPALKLPSLPGLNDSSGPRKAERVGTDLYRVFTSDRALPDTTQRENYVLLRAAETAKEAGATHFVVVNTERGASEMSALVRVFTVARGAEAPQGAVTADEIIHFFGPQFGRATPAATPPA